MKVWWIQLANFEDAQLLEHIKLVETQVQQYCDTYSLSPVEIYVPEW